MKRTNISGVTDEKLARAQKDQIEKMSGEDPVMSWEGWMKFQNLSRAQHLLFEQGKNPFAIPTDPREVWEKIYGDAGMTFDLSGLNFTPPKGDVDYWPIVVAKGMTIQSAWNLCSKMFPCEKRDSLDKDVPINDRVALETYIIFVRANIEADPEFANMSANDLQKKDHKSNTLMERILLEAYYFVVSGGKHLDLKNWTLCAGSRGSLGLVPDAGWGGGQFKVFWCLPDDSYSGLRSRSAVSA